MSYNYEITKDDYIDFNLYHMKNSSSNKIVFILLCYITPILFAIPIYIIGTNVLKQPSYYWVIISLIFIAGWIFTYPKRYNRLIIRECTKSLKRNGSNNILGQKNLTVAEESIVIKGENSIDNIKLSEIKEIKLYKDLILIYLDINTAHIISTSSFTAEEKNALINMLGKK